MPQMMPLSWLMLMTFFSLTFMMFNTMNYFMHTMTSLKKTKKFLKTKKIWNW
uniref:ATP synthase complex subunit 8 n=1 Tax=Cryptocercus punctulatus TaxID=36984 RepID=A0A2P1H9E2_CRYPU|nr:ATP synthase F0 subunit 8 [Cryptocercus punctulatus]AVN68139.1 ATP synthase F0 subunit 8 [Cryptocercus punctulatus]WLF00967.1 ATP synthase F0 subunit 8 [Cryptocercus punctulatus]